LSNISRYVLKVSKTHSLSHYCYFSSNS